MTDLYYAGIGARATPKPILKLMTKIAGYLDDNGLILRSGGAHGADAAFAKGSTNKQIFVPWNGYNQLPLEYFIPDRAFKIASEIHPAWTGLSQAVKKLMARNCMQVMGPNLDCYSAFVLCWTPDGATTEEERSVATGGTGQAIALASICGVPVFNLANEHTRREFDFLEKEGLDYGFSISQETPNNNQFHPRYSNITA